jgi:hypothetical protein
MYAADMKAIWDFGTQLPQAAIGVHDSMHDEMEYANYLDYINEKMRIYDEDYAARLIYFKADLTPRTEEVESTAGTRSSNDKDSLLRQSRTESLWKGLRRIMNLRRGVISSTGNDETRNCLQATLRTVPFSGFIISLVLPGQEIPDCSLSIHHDITTEELHQQIRDLFSHPVTHVFLKLGPEWEDFSRPGSVVNRFLLDGITPCSYLQDDSILRVYPYHSPCREHEFDPIVNEYFYGQDTDSLDFDPTDHNLNEKVGSSGDHTTSLSEQVTPDQRRSLRDRVATFTRKFMKPQGSFRKIFLTTKTLRRILNFKESIMKYGIFVPRNDHEADISPEHLRWDSGRQLEWMRLRDQGTFERNWDWSRVQKRYPKYKKSDVGHMFFVYDFKHSGEHRVRLVFDGSRQNPDTYTETFAPTARGESVRLFHIYAVEEGWMIAQYDVPQAFLKSNIDCNIFVYPPRNFAEFPNQLL